MFYTGVGHAKPFPACQGYILSAVSDDGLDFRPEPGIRLAPQPDVAYRSRRVIAPSVTACPGGWRMYVETRGPAERPSVICSAFSPDMLSWQFEEGIRIETRTDLGAPRYVSLGPDRGRIYCFESDFGPEGKTGGPLQGMSVISAVTADGIHFEIEPGFRLPDARNEQESAGITAAEVIAPADGRTKWIMVYSAWQNPPAGTVVPVHPAEDTTSGDLSSEEFAAASIAVDMCGFRARIYLATSPDGLDWQRQGCILEGGGYDAEGLDAVHAEDMSLLDLGDGRHRMYYAACDGTGAWRVASAVSG
jgi:hypothetical protein